MENPLDETPLETVNPAFAAVVVNDWSTLDWSHELKLDRLSEFDRVSFTTENNSYEIQVLDPKTGDVLVQGGTLFPLSTAARLLGSSLGGGMIRLRSINPGFQIEFALDACRSVITSRVRSAVLVSMA
ncbi:MAG: hypothetical protein ACRD3J_27270 [Thermoanaerobaculia bacterium]